MLCQTCSQRQSCDRPCEKLEQELKSIEVYKRELLMDPGHLSKIGETCRTWPDIFPDHGWIWTELSPYLGALPADVLAPFMLYFLDCRGVVDISKIIGVHRSTVKRRIDKGLELLTRRFNQDGGFVPQEIEERTAPPGPSERPVGREDSPACYSEIP